MEDTFICDFAIGLIYRILLLFLNINEDAKFLCIVWKSVNFYLLFFNIFARVAELVDAHGSGPCVRKNVLVQLQSRVQTILELNIRG